MKLIFRAGSSNSNSSSVINFDEFNSPTGWQIAAAEARLESSQFPLFEEPSHMVVYTISFKRDTYFDPATGTLKRVRTQLNILCCVFWSAFWCCAHPKGGRTTLFQLFSAFFVHFKPYSVISRLKSIILLIISQIKACMLWKVELEQG